jgi:hypothetical protein
VIIRRHVAFSSSTASAVGIADGDAAGAGASRTLLAPETLSVARLACQPADECQDRGKGENEKGGARSINSSAARATSEGDERLKPSAVKRR